MGRDAPEERTDRVEGGEQRSEGGDAIAGDGPSRPPSARLASVLGVASHAKRGVAVGVLVAVGVFGFFVGLPAIDPSRPARPESPVLYLALAFVVATSATLLVTAALAVRAVTARVMDYEKWVRRCGVAGAIGGAWWAVTGGIAAGVAAGVLPADLDGVVRGMLPLPVLLFPVGAWAVLARTGSGEAGTGSGDGHSIDSPDSGTESIAASGADVASAPEFDHVRSRPAIATVGALLVLAGAALVHAATFLETAAFLAVTPPEITGPFVAGSVVLAAGTTALASAVRSQTSRTLLPAVGGALAGVAAGLAAGSAVADAAVLAPIGASTCLGVAWLALGLGVGRDTGEYPDRPL